jgi:hypothetical protein
VGGKKLKREILASMREKRERELSSISKIKKIHGVLFSLYLAHKNMVYM